MDLEALRRIGSKAVIGGSHSGGCRIDHDYSGRCMRPEVVELHARPAGDKPDAYYQRLRDLYGAEFGKPPVQRRGVPKHVLVHSGPSVPQEKRTETPLTVRLSVPCRKCDNCRKAMSWSWRLRAYAEWQIAPRTWLATLTLRPGAFVSIRERLRVRHALNEGVDPKTGEFLADDFDMLPEEAQFTAMVNECAKEVQKFLKRVRKNSDAPLRFLMVCELTKKGAPHFHLLIHETHEGRFIRKNILKAAWQLGHSDYKLVLDRDRAAYVCKYLAKGIARVRASLSYGFPPALAGGNTALAIAERVPPNTQTNDDTPPTTANDGKDGVRDKGP